MCTGLSSILPGAEPPTATPGLCSCLLLLLSPVSLLWCFSLSCSALATVRLLLEQFTAQQRPWLLSFPTLAPNPGLLSQPLPFCTAQTQNKKCLRSNAASHSQGIAVPHWQPALVSQHPSPCVYLTAGTLSVAQRHSSRWLKQNRFHPFLGMWRESFVRSQLQGARLGSWDFSGSERRV